MILEGMRAVSGVVGMGRLNFARCESCRNLSVFIRVHLWFLRLVPQISKRASSFAAQMKSFSESPPIACVTYETRHSL